MSKRYLYLLVILVCLITVGATLILQQGSGTSIGAATNAPTPPPVLLTRFPPPIVTNPPPGRTVVPVTVVTVSTAIVPPGVPAPTTGVPAPTGFPLSAQQRPGIPGIAPRLQGSAPTTPAYTEQDASAFVSTHGIGSATADVSGPISVTKVYFLITSQALAQLGLEWDTAPDRLLCIVQSSGSFSVASPLGGATKFSTAFSYFDAHTGNFLGSTLKP